MESVLKVLPLSVTKLNNSEYAFFMERCIELIAEAGYNAIGISENDSIAFSAQVTMLSSMLKSTRASDETQKLHEFDIKRNHSLSTIFATVRSARTSANATKKESGTSLSLVIKPFRGIQQKPLKQKSQQIISLNEHLNTSDNIIHVERLSLQEELTSLFIFNDEYISLYRKRIAEKDATSCLPYRESCEVLYNFITKKAEGSANILQTAESKYFVTKLNKLIDDMKISYNRRTAYDTAENESVFNETLNN
ncbi:MAG: DUF6261 family protein [Spirochaetales bacterium]